MWEQKPVNVDVRRPAAVSEADRAMRPSPNDQLPFPGTSSEDGAEVFPRGWSNTLPAGHAVDESSTGQRRSSPAAIAAAATPVPRGRVSQPQAEGDVRDEACLGDDTLTALAAGQMAKAARLAALRHVEECSACQDLLVYAMRGFEGDSVGGIGSLALNFAPGSILCDRYRIDRFVARGGMGEVYDAFDLELGERVALKTVLSTDCDSARSQQRLKAEVQLARRVSHPNVCRIYDLGRHDLGDGRSAIHFLTMEYIEGESLGQRLRRGPLAPAEAEAIAEQLLLGLGAAHAAGVLHRDFKSDNVMLRRSAEREQAVITDFGLARVLEPEPGIRHSDSQRLVGSVAYMSPEQVLGEPLGPPSDIYAFGVVLFEMLTRSLPFVAGTPLATAVKRLEEQAPLPSKVKPGIDARWDGFVQRCMNRDPARRYRSAAAALDDFRALRARRMKPALSRGRLWSAAIGAVVVPVSLLVAFFPLGAGQRRPPAASAGGAASAPEGASIVAKAIHSLPASAPSKLTVAEQSISALHPTPGASAASVAAQSGASGAAARPPRDVQGARKRASHAPARAAAPARPLSPELRAAPSATAPFRRSSGAQAHASGGKAPLGELGKGLLERDRLEAAQVSPRGDQGEPAALGADPKADTAQHRARRIELLDPFAGRPSVPTHRTSAQ